MVKFWQNLLIKRLFVFLSIFISIVLSILFCANIALAPHKPKLTHYLSEQFKVPVSAASLTYDFPNKISLNRVRIFKNIHKLKRPAVFVRQISLPFSWSSLIFKRSFVCKRASLHGIEVFSYEFAALLRDNGGYIRDFFAQFSSGKRFMFDLDGAYSFTNSHGPARKIFFSNSTVTHKGLVYSVGDISFDKKMQSLFFSYDATMLLEPKAVGIKSLKLYRDKVYSNFWGNFSGQKLELNGYCQNIPPTVGHKRIKNIAKLFGTSQDVWNIYDIALNVEADIGKARINNLSFSLNNLPVKLFGDIVFGYSTKLGLTCEVGSLSFVVNGKVFDDFFNGTVLVASTRKDDKGGILHDKTAMTIDDLRFDLLSLKKTVVHCGVLVYDYRTALASHKAELTDLIMTIDLSNIKKRFEVEANFYDGFCSFNGNIDPSSAAFFDCDIGVTAVSSEHLRSLFDYFNSVDGKVNGRMYYRAGVDSDFSGHLKMDQGRLREFSFFVWLADTFSVGQLRNVDFTSLALDFLVRKNIVKLTSIDLQSPQVNLTGYYNIEADMVSSKISLSLERSLLEGSPKFNPLVSVVGSGFNDFTFDFQLSGLASSANFKWLDSEFKNRLQKAIPGFIERGIEKKVEDIITSSVEKNQ
jgi:hypothetical protein